MKDRIDKNELSVEYCPTDLMVADYFTKPLQGSLFKKFRSIIMGHETLNDLLCDISMKERVENRNVRGNVHVANNKLIEKSNNDVEAHGKPKCAVRTDGHEQKQKKVTWKDIVSK